MKRKLILMVVATIMATISTEAQRIQTIDKDGQPIPYVTVMTSDAKYIGVTDLDGVIADVKGADTITVSHVAYKAKLYKINGKSGSITLEDADFGLPEIVVKKKPYVYVQTYYRTYMYRENDGIVYYRVGLTDNVYDRATKKLKASTEHTSKAMYGLLKTVVNAAIGGTLDRQSQIRTKKIETAMENSRKDIQLKITDEGQGKKRISDFKGTIGFITDNQATGQRRFSYDNALVRKHRLESEGKKKKLEKEKAREEREKNRKDVDFYLYRIDEDGNYQPEDFMMSQIMTSYDKVEKDSSEVFTLICSQVFTTDRAYVDKDELKKLKKENKMKMTYQNIRQFEQAHKIPPLAPNVQKKLDELWKADD